MSPNVQSAPKNDLQTLGMSRQEAIAHIFNLRKKLATTENKITVEEYTTIKKQIAGLEKVLRQEASNKALTFKNRYLGEEKNVKTPLNVSKNKAANWDITNPEKIPYNLNNKKRKITSYFDDHRSIVRVDDGDDLAIHIESPGADDAGYDQFWYFHDELEYIDKDEDGLDVDLELASAYANLFIDYMKDKYRACCIKKGCILDYSDFHAKIFINWRLFRMF